MAEQSPGQHELKIERERWEKVWNIDELLENETAVHTLERTLGGLDAKSIHNNAPLESKEQRLFNFLRRRLEKVKDKQKK